MLSMTLSQTQAENLVQLLLIAALSDNATTATEDTVLTTHLEALPWVSGIGLSGFVNSAYASIRKHNRVARLEDAKTLAAVFTTVETRAFALQEVQAVLESDGVQATEDELLTVLRASLA